MSLSVLSRAQYLTGSVAGMRRTDYDATHMVKATKGLELSPGAYTKVNISGRDVIINEANKDLAMDWFSEWAANHVRSLARPQKVVVPVPSSKTTLSSAPTFRTALIAPKIAALCPNTTAAPVLRFESEQPNSREEGGTRSALEIHARLRFAGPIPPGLLILVDDVFTSGGHFKAAVWALQDNGRDAKHALCCGRSTEQQMENPFSVPSETIDTAR